MREILYRGKDIAGNWHYGVPLVFTEDFVCMAAPNTYNKKVEANTVGQYTGLTDKNGTKVFEGDILVFCKGATYPYKIIWDGMGWKLIRSDGKRIKEAFECNEIHYVSISEVIGNIHDNPDLLGGDRK